MAAQTHTQAPGKLHKVDPDMLPSPNPPVVTLAEAARLDLDPARARALLGSKAANLARLLGAGFPVPAGVVVTPAALADWDQACTRLRTAAAELGGGADRTQGRARRFAVRSSAAAEDLAGASFAGQYETVLDVGLDQLPEAVQQVFASAAAARVAAYRQSRQAHPQAAVGKASQAAAATAADETAALDASESASGSGMAVLVQVMVAADAAGVGFTANPLTGDRGEVVITAVRGLGERLVAGEAVGDQWVVRGGPDGEAGEATCQDGGEAAITATQALAIAALARRVEAHFAESQARAPQDIEWAIASGQLHLLQARPMTSVPELKPVAWTPPHRGWWLRNFRLGEWLPDAVTPMFADWLVPRIEAGLAAATQREVGVPFRPDSAIVNGWYYTTVRGSTPLPVAILELLGHPRALRWARAFLIDVSSRPERAAPALQEATAAWRDELLPRYRSVVEAGERLVAQASPEELIRLVDEVGELVGEVLWSLSSLGGSAWKIEGVLARFHQRHLAGRVDASHQVLLAGLLGTEPGTDLGAELAAYATPSADWYWPTAGEAETAGADPQAAERHRRLAARRQAAEQACRAALELAGDPALLRRWRRLLELAQRYAVVREQQARLFTLGWPLLRGCALRLGQRLVERAAISEPADVFFLTRRELEAGLRDHAGGQAHDLGMTVQARRAAWQRQRRLPAPLELGSPPWLARRQLHRTLDAARAGAGRQPPQAAAAIAGHAASPGRASGRVRVVVDPTDFARFQPGEVLVARATTPAWTPLFARAAAVVTDGGSLAAHASLVAREYGIPAVVATGDATHRLHTGQLVTVDGNTGVVQPAQSHAR
jgi:pyruvate,water dikinase